MKKLIIIFIATLSFNAFAEELVCEAWYQEKGNVLQKQSMQLVLSTERERKFSTLFQGFEFEVNWNYELTTLYTFIKMDGKNILFTTARIPTTNHPEVFTDLNIPSGPRLSVNCEVH